MLCASCSGDGKSFSQLAGFSEYFAKIPAGQSTKEEQQLLEKYKPSHYLAHGQTKPIDFYQDYIADGRLHWCDGETIAESPDQHTLNYYKNDPRVCFDYYQQKASTDRDKVPVYARVDYANLQNKQVTFLSYNLVFAHSGILQGLPWYKSFPLAIIASLEDWHQLDNYIMVSVVLNSKQRPIALLVQQHNYMSTYMPGVHLPKHDWLAVDIAKRSNEMYPHSSSRQKHRAVSFVTPSSLRYLMGQNQAGLLHGYDITHGQQQLATSLQFLPREDAFYRFVGRLGDKRVLPGRSAPPGAEFNTLPAFKSLVDSLLLAYRRPGLDMEYINLFEQMYSGMDSKLTPQIRSKLADRFIRDLQAQGMDL